VVAQVIDFAERTPTGNHPAICMRLARHLVDNETDSYLKQKSNAVCNRKAYESFCQWVFPRAMTHDTCNLTSPG
jgi:hypothetical protein